MITNKLLGAAGHSGVIPGAWDLTTAVYSGRSFSFPAGSYYGITWKPDGTKFYYCLASSNSYLYEYDATTPWDITSLVYVDRSIVNLTAPNPNGVWFKPDGTKVYLLSVSTSSTHQFSLSTPWDVSTMSSDTGPLVDASEGLPEGLYIRSDGASDGVQVFKVGLTRDTVREFSLSTAWDVGSDTYVQEYNPSLATYDVHFSSDGLKMFILQASTTNSNDAVYEHDLSTAWDISTATYNSVKFIVNSQDGSPRAMTFKPDGTRMYMVGLSNDDVFEYELGD